jgi:hypothetical protein
MLCSDRTAARQHKQQDEGRLGVRQILEAIKIIFELRADQAVPSESVAN